MLNQPTEERLKKMKLSAMASALVEQAQSKATKALDFDERFALLVEAEYLARENRKMDRLLGAAQLKDGTATLENIDCKKSRELDKKLVAELSTGLFIQSATNVLITGATGSGKTYLACALGHKAARLGYRVRYLRIPRFFEEMVLHHAEGTFPHFLERLQRVQLLILDDFGLVPVTAPQRRDLLEVMEDRYGCRATIVSSQLPVEQWHASVQDPTIADAMLDRLVHKAYRISLRGESMRKEVKR